MTIALRTRFIMTTVAVSGDVGRGGTSADRLLQVQMADHNVLLMPASTGNRALLFVTEMFNGE